MGADMDPEVQVSTRPVFGGKIIRVRVDTVKLPGGRHATREVVEHNAAVVIVPVDPEGNVILVRQYRYPVGETLLEAPAGTVENAEAPEECAQRELQEETGYAAADIRPLGEFWTTPGFCNEYMYAFLARDLVPSRLEADADEIIKVERLPLSHAVDMIRQGEIKDAKTIAALLMAFDVIRESS
jgi:ADP-ribose pyrophosphatase